MIEFERARAVLPMNQATRGGVVGVELPNMGAVDRVLQDFGRQPV
jgi:hypothetical protein